MRDRYKILAAKEMAQGSPKKGMVRIASFRYESNAQYLWRHLTGIEMRDWYLQLTDGIDILEVYDPKGNSDAVPVTGHLAKE